ncbi:MAG: helix-turn-helix domain-containing protein [Actinoallomurus sp.]
MPPNTSPEEGLLTPREVAEMLGVRVTTVGRWARTGVLKPVAHAPGRPSPLRPRRRTRPPRSRRTRHQPRTPAARRRRRTPLPTSIRQVAARFELGYGAMRRVLLRRTPLRTREGDRS